MEIFTNVLVVSLLAISLDIQTANATGQLHEICSNQTFTSESNYEKNLNALLDDLKSKTPNSGFDLSTSGASPDQVFGLAQCRGDVSNADCEACISTATSAIRNLCVTAKISYIWYDECFLRYSDASISNIVDFSDGLIFPGSGDVTEMDVFFANARDLFTHLSQDASISPKYFAAGETTYATTRKIYGSIDCTRDLTITNCHNCMGWLVGLLTSDQVGNGNVGRIVTASCTLRYDTFAFFNATY